MALKRYKSLIFSAVCLAFSFSSNAACPQAAPVNSDAFCYSFQSVAECHCKASGLPKKMCDNIPLVYQRMISTFGTIERACRYQKETSFQNCMNDWQCYLNGGTTSDGLLCNGTGAACA